MERRDFAKKTTLATAAPWIPHVAQQTLRGNINRSVEQYELICAMPFGPAAEGKKRLTDSFNRLENHEWLMPLYKKRIQAVAEAGYPSVICFAGNRNGLDDPTGLQHCTRGINALIPYSRTFRSNPVHGTIK